MTDMNMNGKVAIITGAARGIGRAMAQTFAKAGCELMLADLRVEEVQSVAASLAIDGRRALAMQADVSKSDQVMNLISATHSAFGRIDVLINNAATFQVAPILQLTEEDWDRMMAINLKSVFLCSKAVMPIMMEQRTGRIINFCSVVAKTGGKTVGANYSASKAGVMCLTKSLATTLGSYGVTVNAVAPGIIDTELSRGIPGTDKQAAASPLGRVGQPEDVANAVLFLASDRASYITGEILDVNGGMLMD